MQKLSTKVRRLSRQLSNIPQLLQNVQRNNQMSTGAAFVGLDNLNTLNLWRLNPATSSSSFINRRTIQFNNNDDDDDETKENLQKQVNERTIQFMSIVYAILLIIIGAMCTFFNISKPNNQIRDIFVIIISIISAIVICFFHYDIIKFRHWALQRIENERRQQRRRQSTNQISNAAAAADIAIISNGNNNVQINEDDDDDNNDDQVPAYDTLSLTTAVIFDYYDKANSNNHLDDDDDEQFNENGVNSNDEIRPVNDDNKKSDDTMIAYRYFRGRHANDFYLKIGMIGKFENIDFLVFFVKKK